MTEIIPLSQKYLFFARQVTELDVQNRINHLNSWSPYPHFSPLQASFCSCHIIKIVKRLIRQSREDDKNKEVTNLENSAR